ncbi:MAG: ornithine carbamoyltransferase [Candidatus Methanoperedens nitroreducens]|uniref:Ornithine carbamoyltransferase n=1 Tax=Candidatus Methanoperedens nitratireducens TaxID=1392998 RepID=A0A0P7ZE26_9EURY|nr:ornithine carbamoyltransferase [Candidatus Methanoperedens sp. BLZ2]KAB2945653.1 MAG: ornithine carbamoyltransferase [Candidatus Methanoperedens sp.]KPQ42956.1 MAG: ornithine carbamoyltransferase [Candidatus Methanoperedens sp. BLZ1]MBZ0177280.1 ornithine carbamoyltransferase [Candidatus Methanoperedens nitroreducens]MCX9076841.1 ornithine carbamoyltransferase [Candidatus Methanoperedens sp.]MCX9086744.1 ornithine carbamoyltransferase [Candidatus Methanoperedens sp.]
MSSHLLSISDLSYADIIYLLDTASDLKEKRARGKTFDILKNKTLAMLFEKSSTRTRLSFEVAMTDLGGHAIYLNYKDMQLGRGESVADTARVMSRYVHAIMARVYKHETLVELSENGTVPVINGLSDLEHPCQLLADLLTIREYKGKFKGLNFVWIGDGNNVCNSAMLACALTGMKMTAACPQGYEPNAEILAKARALGGTINIINDPMKAAKKADILSTDVWVSMGDEEEYDQRLHDFAPYQINSKLLEQAKHDVMVLHCLPAHRGEEITAEVVDGPNSAVFDQAENRLHVQKALLLKLLS